MQMLKDPRFVRMPFCCQYFYSSVSALFLRQRLFQLQVLVSEQTKAWTSLVSKQTELEFQMKISHARAKLDHVTSCLNDMQAEQIKNLTAKHDRSKVLKRKYETSVMIHIKLLDF